MIQVQVISKILDTGDYSIVENNSLDESYFTGYEKEFKFIQSHYNKYKKVPDKATFLEKFTDFNLQKVSETDEYLLNKLNEDRLFNKTLPWLQKVSELYEEGATNEALEYLSAQLKTVEIGNQIGGIDIIQNATRRYDDFIDRKKNQSNWYFATGFPELDTLIHGIQRTEELLIIFARINQGKSWILEKMCASVWEQGFNVGYISPEMTASSIGYRFDTLYKNFSNKELMWGNNISDDKEYNNYLKALEKNQNKFVVATPLDFSNRITISKLRLWIRQNNLDMLAIDGLTYLSDERGSFRDNKTTSLTNISEDLMSLSVEMRIPILAVVQANRQGVAEEDTKGTPELETIRDSDGMAMNASKVLSIKQKDGILEIGVKKQRNGAVGGLIKYSWDIDKGEFSWIPGDGDGMPETAKAEKIEEDKQIYQDVSDVF